MMNNFFFNFYHCTFNFKSFIILSYFVSFSLNLSFVLSFPLPVLFSCTFHLNILYI
ncbi:hypothetical protein RhiirB3_475316 [Rhizophagus irregularis]|nr:hypothetical protein RhiirB3_475316 [Rhizophagus irregularis]